MDEYLAKHGTIVGPLHGLPVSLKDQFPIKGLETTMGMPNSSSEPGGGILTRQWMDAKGMLHG